MSDDFRIPTKNELREAIDKAHDEEVKSLRDELARVRSTRDSHESQLVRISKALGGKDARHSADGTIAELVETTLAAAVAERDELQRQLAKAMVLIRRYSERRAGAANIGMELNRMAGVLLAEYDAALVARLDATTGGVEHKGATNGD